jgi:hypothetical protein
MLLKLNGVKSETIAVGKFMKSIQLFILNYTVNLPDSIADKCFVVQKKGSNQYIQLMHKRLLHASANKMKIMHKATEGVKQMLIMKPHECIVCAETKLKKKAVSKETISNASKTLKRVYIDILGPFPKFVSGNVYSMTITNSSIKHNWVRHLWKKGDCFTAFAEWIKIVEAKISFKMKYICCDNRGEFDSTAFKT